MRRSASKAIDSWAATDVGDRLNAAVDLLERLAHRGDAARPVAATPGWSVGDVYAHLAIECDRYAREVEGASDWSTTGSAIAETNRRALQEFTERGLGVLLSRIRDGISRYVAALEHLDLDERTHALDGGILLTPRHGAAVLLGELVVHAHDVGDALGHHVTIAPDDAAFIVTGAMHASPAFVDRRRASSAKATVELRLRDHPRIAVTVDRGDVTVGAPTAAPDAVVWAEPVTFLLVAYGRKSEWTGLATLRFLAWGRRPHKAFLLRRLFIRP